MQHLRAFDTGEVFDYQRALEVLGSKEKVLGAAQLSHRLWPDCLNGIRVALKRGRLDRAADEALALRTIVGFLMVPLASAAIENLLQEILAGRLDEARQARETVVCEIERAWEAFDLVFAPPGCAAGQHNVVRQAR